MGLFFCSIRKKLKIMNKIKIFLSIVFSLLLFNLLLVIPAKAQTGAIQTNVPALKDVYKNDFQIGCLLSYRHVGFPDDPPVPGQSAVISYYGGQLIKFHMNSMSPGNNMKPQYTVDINASAAAYNSASGADKEFADTNPVVKFNGDLIAQLNWAKRQGFTFRGHTLVWHSQTPGTAFFRTGYSSTGARLTKEKMTARLENYIKEVIRLIHEGWPGLLSAMDVVNEAVNDNGNDRTTDSEWYQTFGDNSYIMKAFEFTRKYSIQYGETQIKLYYNDYNTHLANKANGIVRICAPIFQAGFLDGIGMQEHNSTTTPTASQWIASYNKFEPICSEMAVTELDVRTFSSNPSALILSQQANQYAQLFKCFVERSYYSGRGKIINVSKDGLNDQYTFVTNESTSLWDANNQCKPAFYAVVDVGIYYNKLDSLLNYVKSLTESEYTSQSWANYTNALNSAKNSFTQNYSTSTSAHTSLKNSFVDLNKAVTDLQKLSTNINTTNEIPSAFSLEQNYPNPFNPSTVIEYQIAAYSHVHLIVYDLLGREVAVLVNEYKQPGKYNVEFRVQSAELPSGVYLYNLRAGNFSETRKLILLK